MAWIYAVRKGYAPGLYYDVDSYQKQVDGFPGAEGRRFQDEAAAKRYLAGEDTSKKGIYAVRRGRVPGIYYSAAACEAQVRGFNGAQSQRFATLAEAQAYMGQESGGAAAEKPKERVVKKRHILRPRSVRPRREAPHPGARSLLAANGAAKSSFQPILIYTDGGCLVHEDGAGGYAAVICLPNGNYKEISGGVDMTRSDRMELLAAAAALRTLDSYATPGERVQVYTDSQYLYQGVTKKIWTEWTPEEANQALNNDLWRELAALTANYQVTWFWVKGHNGNPMNERCDWLATAAAKRTVAEKQWVPDYAAQLETAKNRIRELERNNRKLSSDTDRFRLLAEDRLSVADKDLFRAIYHESLTGYLRWKVRRWFSRRHN